jgi:hypothetical protein
MVPSRKYAFNNNFFFPLLCVCVIKGTARQFENEYMKRNATFGVSKSWTNSLL